MVASRVSRSRRRRRSSSSSISARLGIDGACVDHAEARVLGERGLAGREIGAACCELGLRARERLLGLVERGDPLLDVREALLGGLGRGCRASCEIGLHPQERLLARHEVALASIQLLRVRREPGLRVLDGVVVAAAATAGAPVHAGDGIGELALALLDRGDALGQLAAKASELLLGGDPDRVQALLLALDRDRLGLLPAEESHASMICAGRPFSCFELRGALESLFGARATDDLLALAEAQTGLLDAKRLPECLESLVELLDLVFYGRVETLGELLPELLALLRELLDLRMDLIGVTVS